ncbi:hypothetical protein FAUST_2048 [Fusarium austroamericanum]|uniref:Small acidic protein n=1 Tax=Fusarium austroamericanum TaxID=282268 RepID=A0AAN6C7Z8_FUSAU|nr:hypothetical protein FAUST_2048 [Fusarium austroamericanum]
MASHPATKTKPAKTLKPRQSKAAMLEKRQAKRVAKAEKRAEKMAKAKANAEAKKVVGGAPRKEKHGAKKRVISDAKKKSKLKLRVEKLEKKANNLFKEAKKAAAQYQALLDAEKNAAESKPEQDSNNDDDDSSSDSDTSSESGASEASDASENKGGVPVKQEPTEVPEDTPADEIVMKHRRLSNAGSERSRISVADVPSEAEEEPKKSKKDKKSKKEKKVKIVEPEEAKEEVIKSKSEDEDEEPKVSDKKAKKAEKKRKREAEAKAKAEKNSEESAAQAEQWQVDGLEGGSERQAKFMRLLGGKKAGAAAPAAHGSASKGTSDSTKAEAEIQKQFEAGMKMKNEGGSKRRGLGA